MGPLLTANITVHTIWCGTGQKKIIREFINSISAVKSKRPWWKTVQLYTNQTGANIFHTVRWREEKNDCLYCYGKSLTRLSVRHWSEIAELATNPFWSEKENQQ